MIAVTSHRPSGDSTRRTCRRVRCQPGGDPAPVGRGGQAPVSNTRPSIGTRRTGRPARPRRAGIGKGSGTPGPRASGTVSAHRCTWPSRTARAVRRCFWKWRFPRMVIDHRQRPQVRRASVPVRERVRPAKRVGPRLHPRGHRLAVRGDGRGTAVAFAVYRDCRTTRPSAVSHTVIDAVRHQRVAVGVAGRARVRPGASPGRPRRGAARPG